MFPPGIHAGNGRFPSRIGFDVHGLVVPICQEPKSYDQEGDQDVEDCFLIDLVHLKSPSSSAFEYGCLKVLFLKSVNCLIWIFKWSKSAGFHQLQRLHLSEPRYPNWQNP